MSYIRSVTAFQDGKSMRMLRKKSHKNSMGLLNFDRTDRLGGQTFATAGKTHLFGGRRLNADAVDIDADNLGDTGAHGFAVRLDLGAFADQGNVDIDNRTAVLRD